jgi:hypothetical protein
MRRLGAVEEGVLRRHMATASGRVRDTVYFSVLADEWPACGPPGRALAQPSPAIAAARPPATANPEPD